MEQTISVFFEVPEESTYPFDHDSSIGPCVEHYRAGLRTAEGDDILSIVIPPEVVQKTVLLNAKFGLDMSESGLVAAYPHSMENDAVAAADRTGKIFEKWHVDDLVVNMLQQTDEECVVFLDELRERLSRSLSLVEQAIEIRDRAQSGDSNRPLPPSDS